MPKNKNTLLVCIDAHPKTSILLRIAANKAKSSNMNWSVLYVENTEHYQLDSKSRERILQYLTMAQTMGAKIHHIEGKSKLESIASFIEDNENITSIIIGERQHGGILSIIRPSLSQKLRRKLTNKEIELQVVPITSKNYSVSLIERLSLNDFSIKGMLFAIFSVFCAYLLSQFLRGSIPYIEWRINVHNFTAFFLIACVVTSFRYGLASGLISAILGYTVMNYYYVPPLHKFGIEHSGDKVSLGIFSMSAFLLSFMGSYSRASKEALLNKERRSQILFQINRIASEANNRMQAVELIHSELVRVFKMNMAFFTPSYFNEPIRKSVYPKTQGLSETDIKHLEKCWEKVQTTGYGADRKPGTKWRFEPMVTSNGVIGVMGAQIPKNIKLDATFGRLCNAIADQIAYILERIDLMSKINNAQITAEKEQLRSMLLSSVSHDLKTPLASIIGSLSVYERMKNTKKLSPANANELIQTALQEAQRLDSFITNILGMTRIESGDIEFDIKWENSLIPIETVRKRLGHRLIDHNLIIDIDERQEIMMDTSMTEQVLQNVLDNAVKYSSKKSDIKIYSDTKKGFSYIIRDYGYGIPDEKLELVFDKYERLKHKDSTVAGTGLGLAICKAIMEKQGGDIYARNHKDGGAEFVICFKKRRKMKSNDYYIEQTEKVYA